MCFIMRQESGQLRIWLDNNVWSSHAGLAALVVLVVLVVPVALVTQVVAHRLRLPLLFFCGRAPAVEAICVWQQFGSADKGCETCRPQPSAHLFDENKVGVNSAGERPV
jgi:hypothetical protein